MAETLTSIRAVVILLSAGGRDRLTRGAAVSGNPASQHLEAIADDLFNQIEVSRPTTLAGAIAALECI